MGDGLTYRVAAGLGAAALQQTHLLYIINKAAAAEVSAAVAAAEGQGGRASDGAAPRPPVAAAVQRRAAASLAALAEQQLLFGGSAVRLVLELGDSRPAAALQKTVLRPAALVDLWDKCAAVLCWSAGILGGWMAGRPGGWACERLCMLPPLKLASPHACANILTYLHAYRDLSVPCSGPAHAPSLIKGRMKYMPLWQLGCPQTHPSFSEHSFS